MLKSGTFYCHKDICEKILGLRRMMSINVPWLSLREDEIKKKYFGVSSLQTLKFFVILSINIFQE